MLKSPKNQVALFLSLTIILLAYSSSSLCCQATVLDASSAVVKYEVTTVFTGSIKHVIQVGNLANKAVIDGKLFVPLFKNETSRHLIVISNISSSAGEHNILVDDFGNIYAVWNNLRIDGGRTFTVEVSYRVVSFGMHYLINPSLVADYDKNSSIYLTYTQPEELIESNSQEIILAAQNIIGSESDVHEKVLKIYNFVVGHLKYKVQEEEMGALWALRNGTGDCSEFSYLFVALCRAAGIPARVQAGFAFHSETAAVEDGHMWAEYYLENYGWVPIDATWHLFDTLDHLHFGSLRSMSTVIPYSNFFFNYTNGPNEEFISEDQRVSIKPLLKTTFGDSFVTDIADSVVEMVKAKNVMFLGEILGASTIFPSEVSEAEQNLQESMILLQEALEALEENPQLARLNAADALKSTERALYTSWVIIAKLLTMFVGVLTVVMVAAFTFLMKRYGVRWKAQKDEQHKQ